MSLDDELGALLDSLPVAQPAKRRVLQADRVRQAVCEEIPKLSTMLERVEAHAGPDVGDLPNIHERATAALKALRQLSERAEDGRVATLFGGMVNSGKSSLLNATVGQKVCPVGDQATTAGLLSIRTVVDANECCLSYRHQHASGDQRVLATGDASVVYRALKQVAQSLRSRGDTESLASDLELVIPTPKHIRDAGLNLHLVDSPGSNEALSPAIRSRWCSMTNASDLIVIVCDYFQLESNDQSAFWLQLADLLQSSAAARNFLVFVSKYDMASRGRTAEQRSQHLAKTKQTVVDTVSAFTRGVICLTVDQIFAGSARLAMLAQVATGLSDSISDDDELLNLAYDALHIEASSVYGACEQRLEQRERGKWLDRVHRGVNPQEYDERHCPHEQAPHPRAWDGIVDSKPVQRAGCAARQDPCIL
ncbi:hypothetical protein P3T76_012296 [Phytophthora citrophthora]|uniref:Dynamin N-terminal domain-containing protein n=1 Tax=Phytophthora citrophthora TaxID=4793 RepID=A0AAD9LE06_9STRA|nr:hypothetical protein P3T76_012296 [Phytophthora citrophthora]